MSKANCAVIGASLSEPHTYRTAEQILLIYIYIYICAVRPSVWKFGPAKGPFKRANVELASKGSKVNNIALKMATLVLRFS